MILAFGLVYLFWGSTYLAIDIAVQTIPPALMCGVRFLIAGTFMLAFCWWRGRNIRYNARQLARMAAVGVLLLMGGNLTLSYAEKHIGSGLAALLLASTPLFFLVLDTLLLGNHHVCARGKIGLALGAVGLAVLLWPDLTTTGAFGRVQLWSSLSLLFGSLSWALGSVLVAFGGKKGEGKSRGENKLNFIDGEADQIRETQRHYNIVCTPRYSIMKEALGHHKRS